MTSNDFSLSPVVSQEHLQPEGHDVRYDFSLYNAAALQQERTFTQYYYAPCATLPTTWKFALTFRKDSNTGVVSGDAILERFDSFNVPVTAHFVVTFRHNDFYLDYVPGGGANRRIRPSGKKRSRIHTIVPHEFKHLLRGEILVVVHISIRNCHQERKQSLAIPVAGDGTGARRGKLYFSKL